MKAFALYLLIALAAVAQQPPAHNGEAAPKIMTATRPVVMFTRIEQALLAAIQKKDLDAVKTQLAEDFESQRPSATPIARDAWLQIVSTAPAYSAFRVSQVFVHSVSADVALVSFVQSVKLDDKGSKLEDTYVVDYWQAQDGVWKLKVRYASPVKDLPHDEPKPTGKQ